MNVSAVLLNWKRPWNMPRIVNHLASIPDINEIIVRDQSGTLDTYMKSRPVREDLAFTVVRATKNTCTYGRFQSAVSLATNDWIYTQDDDVIVNNIYDVLAGRYSHPNHITHALTDGHMKQEGGKAAWAQIGWGSVFRRDWIESAFKQWIDAYGEDDSTLLHRKADRIFTMIVGMQRHNPILADVERLKDPDGRFSDSSADSLWKQNDHFRLTSEAAEKCKQIMEKQ